MNLLDRIWPGLIRNFVVNSIIGSPFFPLPLRWRALRAYGMHIESCAILPGVKFGSARVSIGEGTFVNEDCVFANSVLVSIGRRCDIAHDVMFVTNTHELGDDQRRAGASKTAPIQVGDGCWIGARAVILPGVAIGSGTIIAAGAIVSQDCEAHSLYAGVPARKIRDLAVTAFSV